MEVVAMEAMEVVDTGGMEVVDTGQDMGATEAAMALDMEAMEAHTGVMEAMDLHLVVRIRDLGPGGCTEGAMEGWAIRGPWGSAEVWKTAHKQRSS